MCLLLVCGGPCGAVAMWICAALVESAFAMRHWRETCWCKRGVSLVSDKSVPREFPTRVSRN